MVADKNGISLTITVIETKDFDIDELIGYYKYNGFSVFVPIGEQRKTNKNQPYHVLTYWESFLRREIEYFQRRFT